MPNRVGRKSKYDPLITPSLAEDYAKELLTNAQIAAKLGISHETFCQWQNKYIEFAEAIKRGKAVSNVALVKAMQKSAEGYYVEEEDTVVYLDKNKQPKSYSRIKKKRYIPPSTTTQIFLAKNRMPEDFRDVNRHEVDMRGQLQVNTLADLMMEEFRNEESKETSAIARESESD